MHKIIGNDWDELLQNEYEKEYYIKLQRHIDNERKHFTVYPKPECVFRALHLTPYEKVRVVILGQDPYHGEGQAHGLAFSVPDDIKIPPSLKNIFVEINRDIGIPIPISGNLTTWAEKGVLLLNSIMTVRQAEPLSHKKLGWERFTDKIINLLNERKEPVIFMLWGNSAIAKKTLITNTHHTILTAAHPSPLSAHRGFFGCGHFGIAKDVFTPI